MIQTVCKIFVTFTLLGALTVPMPGMAQSASSPWDKQRWVRKVVASLHAGRSHDPEYYARLEQLPPDEVVSQVMDDPLFGDAALAFALFYLGFSPDYIYREGVGYNYAVSTKPQATVAAIEAVRSGNFLRIFDFQLPFVVPRIGIPSGAPAGYSPERARRYQRAIALQQIDQLIAAMSLPNPGDEPLCGIGRQIEGGFRGNLTKAGLPAWINHSIPYSDQWLRSVTGFCALGEPRPRDVIAVLERVRSQTSQLFDWLNTLAASQRVPKTLLDLNVVDADQIHLADQFTQLPAVWFGYELPNTSTNMNRKRAAYFMKNVLCDDLTPTGFPVEADPGGERHGSLPACQSCHYKLDPMAGFFRNRGIQALNYSGHASIIFNDLVALDRATYEANWRRPDGTWNVGVVESATDPARNWYGSEPEQLFEYFKQSPAVRRCLAKRLKDFFWGEEQAIDGDYFESSVVKPILDTPVERSAIGIRQAVANLLLSQTFAQDDPDPEQCYDVAGNPGATESRPPCRVAHIFREYCGSCHGPSSPMGGLSLVTWEQNPYGELSFPHRDRSGQPLPRSETMRQLKEALTRTDARRMPLGQHMPDTVRVAMLNFVERMLEDGDHP